MNINIKGQLYDLCKPRVMGIINITPNSFYENSRITDLKLIEEKIFEMIEDGADIIDIGAMSTRPNSKIISHEEEWIRLEPILNMILSKFNNFIFSLDTIHSEICKRAVNDYGVSIINDVSAGFYDTKMFETIADLNVPYILMHIQGHLEEMTKNTHYTSLMEDIIFFLSERVKKLNSLGVNDIIIDPGFGFSKTLEQNFELLANLDRFKIFKSPILVGISRKTMIWKTLDIDVNDSLNGSTVLNTISLQQGANIIRVHDVKEAKECIILSEKLFENKNGSNNKAG